MTRCGVTAGAIGAAFLVFTLAALSANAQEATRFYFKEALPLRVDPTRVAVREDGARRTPEARRVALIAAGLDAESGKAWESDGWVLYTVKPAAEAEAAQVAALDPRAAVAAASALGFASPVFVDDRGQPMFVTPSVLVGFDRELGDAAVRERAAEFGAVAPGNLAEMPATLRVTPNTGNGWDVLDAANAMAQRGDVLFAEPDMAFRGTAALIPNDPGFEYCWGLLNTVQLGGVAGMDMGASVAWDTTTGDPSVITVVLDVGVQQNHPDLNQIAGKDFTTTPGVDGGPANSCESHGTPVAGCVSAKINNSAGTVGVAPETRIASARPFVGSTACDGSWSTNSSWTASALAWAQSIGARVTNNSNIYGFTSATIDQKYLETRNAGLVHFACAGNSATSSLAYPASLVTVNAVASLSPWGVRSGFSNYGSGLDFIAPGESVLSTDRTGPIGYAGGDEAFVQGTSFASPYAAGVAALVLSRNPMLNSRQVTRIMQQTARDLGATGYDTGYGYGLVRADLAVARACLSDFNGDGFLTFEDFDAFIDAFNRGVIGADFNADNQINFSDFDAFVTAFERGC